MVLSFSKPPRSLPHWPHSSTRLVDRAFHRWEFTKPRVGVHWHQHFRAHTRTSPMTWLPSQALSLTQQAAHRQQRVQAHYTAAAPQQHTNDEAAHCIFLQVADNPICAQLVPDVVSFSFFYFGSCLESSVAHSN